MNSSAATRGTSRRLPSWTLASSPLATNFRIVVGESFQSSASSVTLSSSSGSMVPALMTPAYSAPRATAAISAA
jgi:hypothetical protein